MHVKAIDARYARYLKAAIATAVHDIHHDAKRRELGCAPSIADALIDPEADGKVAVFVGEQSTIEAVSELLLTAGATV